MRKYLKTELFLELHPKKIYFQHFSKGVPFLGAIIKPHRIYVRNRTKGNFYKKIKYWNSFIEEKQHRLTDDELEKFLASMNSYLGLMKHCSTYKLRKKMIEQDLSPYFQDYVYISKKFEMIILKNKKNLPQIQGIYY